jgi:Uma2 family endonuclease
VNGVVREAAAPTFFHQRVVGRLYRSLADAAEPALGVVVMAPVDVVLDPKRALVVQPDVLFVSAERAGICRDQVWGAPDLTVEVLSPRTAGIDQRVKAGWYRDYGVRECWLVDPVECWVEVLDLQRPSCARRFEDDQVVLSSVLPSLRLPVGRVFGSAKPTD